MTHNLFNTRQEFKTGSGADGVFYSLPQLEEALNAENHPVGETPTPLLRKEGSPVNISRLPISIRIVLESVLRNFDGGKKISEANVRALAGWAATGERTEEIPFVVARVILQDFTGVPLLVDLAAMRSAVERMGKDLCLIEPLVPVDLVIDHSVQVDYAGSETAYRRNMEMEFRRNEQRYRFLKWGTQAFSGFSVVPPGIGIVHQVNLEYLAKGVFERMGVFFPDTLVGTDSHTTMINGLGIVGWGVGGIEAEAGMLGQPVYFLTPDVVGVHLTGELPQGSTATDLVLRITEMLRKAGVVGKFVEFFGDGAASLNATDRATIANMAPEYGATIGFFPTDEKTLDYFANTGRTDEHIKTIRNYYNAQEMFGIPKEGEVDYTTVLELQLETINPSVAGPKRPQDRIELSNLDDRFIELFTKAVAEGGYGKQPEDLDKRFMVTMGSGGNGHRAGGGEQSQKSAPESIHDTVSPINTNVTTEIEMMNNRPTPNRVDADDAEAVSTTIGNGDVLIAAITSCTNTSNPSVMIAAGIVAKKAVERGMKVPPFVKTSLAPGSRVVTEYLEKTGLQKYLNEIGFDLVGYGCTTCIGNSGPLDAAIEEEIVENDIIAASVLSGNRNFEARVHQNIKANFLMSPPLVVAYALAGTVVKDVYLHPLGQDRDGNDVFLKDIWASLDEVKDVLQTAFDPAVYKKLYSEFAEQNPMWNDIPSSEGLLYEWDTNSTYIQEPPYFEDFSMETGKFSDIKGARALAIFGDSVTTDHISPAGAIKANSPAGLYLQENGVEPQNFNSYGSRRGNDRVMLRGTFANVRIKNLMVAPVEGGFTKFYPLVTAPGSDNSTPSADHPADEASAPLLKPGGELNPATPPKTGGVQEMTIYDAAMKYRQGNTPLMIFAGSEYGTGSSRDWAAKGTRLMGVKAVVAQSFERIHRSNLVGMGVLPLQFKEGQSAASLNLDGTEIFDLIGLEGTNVRPMQDATLVVHRAGGSSEKIILTLRIDTPIEIEYYKSGGILPYVLQQLLSSQAAGGRS